MDNYAQQEPSQPQQPTNPQGNVGFAQPRQPEQGNPWIWIVGIIIALLIIVVGGWFLMRSFSDDNESAGGSTPSPTAAGLNTYATPEPTSTPTPAPTTEPVAMSELQALVLNGTGTPGEASLLKSELVELGFDSDSVEAANADSQDETETTVTFGEKVDTKTRQEVEELLEETYESVVVKNTQLTDVDLKIIIGSRIDTATESE